jgi:adenosylcobinamide-GDP ribazoletransferase
VTGLVAAVRYLTIVPLPGPQPQEALGRSAPWFPVVGIGLGLVLAAIERGLAPLFPTILVAVLVVAAWKLLTGGLHLDGLADSLDGLMGRDRRQRLAIMRDSRIGTFGAMGLILLLLVGLTAVAELPDHGRWRALIVAPAIGRSAPPLIAMVLPATGGGYGAAFARAVTPLGALIGIAAAGGVATLALGWAGVAALVAGLGAALAIAWLLARPLGGATGDTLGAGVEVAELGALLALVAWLGAGTP